MWRGREREGRGGRGGGERERGELMECTDLIPLLYTNRLAHALLNPSMSFFISACAYSTLNSSFAVANLAWQRTKLARLHIRLWLYEFMYAFIFM